MSTLISFFGVCCGGNEGGDAGKEYNNDDGDVGVDKDEDGWTELFVEIVGLEFNPGDIIGVKVASEDTGGKIVER